MGVPFESIYPAVMRQAIMSRALNYLGVCLTLPPDTSILSPIDGLFTNAVPTFSGAASDNVVTVEVSIKAVTDSIFYNGSIFSDSAEIWLTATGTNPWAYALPALADGAYALRARARVSDLLVDDTPSAITFTMDTVAPLTPTLITPTGGISLTSIAPTFSWLSDGDPTHFEINLDDVTTTLNSPLTSTQLAVGVGTHQWRVRAIDAASNASAWSERESFQVDRLLAYLPIVLQNYSAEILTGTPTCNNVIVNGDFETGDWSPQWQLGAATSMPGVITSTVYAGSTSARVGVAPDAVAGAIGFSSIQQFVAIPSNALTATLTFARYAYSTDPAHDLQYVAVVAPNNAVLDYLVYERSNAQVWQTFVGDVLTYAGQSIGLRFSAKNSNLGGTTGLLFDDVVLMVCTP
jgi:hypothetical protein